MSLPTTISFRKILILAAIVAMTLDSRMILAGESKKVNGLTQPWGISSLLLQKAVSAPEERTDRNSGMSLNENEWKSQDLTLLGIGMGVGDLDGDGNNEIVVIDPSTVYVYRFAQNELAPIAEYTPSSLELKSVDVMKPDKRGPARIYVSAQNRGSVVSFVLELRNNTLVPVVQNIPYFLRVISYPTVGNLLLGQRKGMRRMYDGPIYQMVDSGNSVEPGNRFGVPLKIPIFGFTIGDFEAKRQPLIAVFDREDHIRLYEPSGRKMYVSPDFYGGSDIILRWGGPELRKTDSVQEADSEVEFFRPRLLAFDSYTESIHQLLTIYHSSKTRRLLSRTKMLEEGQIMGLRWNGDAFTEAWATPKLQGMITDFAVDHVPGSKELKLIILERKKTDWLSFIRSRSQIRTYDLEPLLRGK